MTEHADLPIPDYDRLPVGDLAGRIRALDLEQLRALLDHEEAHGSRTRVLEVLRHRLDAVIGGAEPSPGDPAAAPPAPAPPPAGGSPVSGRGARENNQPLRHGVAAQTPNRDIRGR